MPVVLRSLRDVLGAWEIVFSANGPGEEFFDHAHPDATVGWIVKAVDELRRVVRKVIELALTKHVVVQLPRAHTDHLGFATLREAVQFVEALPVFWEMKRRVIALGVWQTAEPRFGVDTAELRGR